MLVSIQSRLLQVSRTLRGRAGIACLILSVLLIAGCASSSLNAFYSRGPASPQRLHVKLEPPTKAERSSVLLVEGFLLLSRDLERRVLATDTAGQEILRIHLKNFDNGGGGFLNLWFLSSLATMFTINLFGFPMQHQTAHVELDVAVLDKSDEIFKQFTVAADAAEYCAMFWGYPMVGAGVVDEKFELTRATSLSAWRKLSAQICSRLTADAAEINAALPHAQELSHRPRKGISTSYHGLYTQSS